MTNSRSVFAFAVCAVAVLVTIDAVAGEPKRGKADSGKPEVYTNSHFILHTDLPPTDAEEKLARMESTLMLAVKYWGRQPRGRIECYVVKNLSNWTDTELPHPLARVWVDKIGGATISQRDGVGNTARPIATIYAASTPGIVEHEVIHGYCCQTFGATGPDWYKEGMAEITVFRDGDDRRVQCTRDLIQSFQDDKRRTIDEILDGDRFTYEISDALTKLMADRADQNAHLPLGDWSQKHTDDVRIAKKSYAWSWTLCHLLLHNPNYATRFRSLGDSYLGKGGDTFDTIFSPVHDELLFEYKFFMNHIDVNYRVDLCQWDWKTRFRTLEKARTVNSRISAARGYQASGLTVTGDQEYAFDADGTWSTSATGDLISADGGAKGRGKLVGVVMRDYELGKPFDLGTTGKFVAPASGNLYLRCQDAWNQLDDNRGELYVKLTLP